VLMSCCLVQIRVHDLWRPVRGIIAKKRWFLHDAAFTRSDGYLKKTSINFVGEILESLYVKSFAGSLHHRLVLQTRR